ncbi:hypothetical protein [Halobacillus salinus]|uniref:hypothetical protein n=1 Tax=Halobacillus salinus TaxID=192814 RepID=UPI0014576FBF|nr:hypothetical protein [Halobacillus salinus]
MTQYTKKNEAGKTEKTIVDSKKQHAEFAKEFGSAKANEKRKEEIKKIRKADKPQQ